MSQAQVIAQKAFETWVHETAAIFTKLAEEQPDIFMQGTAAVVQPSEVPGQRDAFLKGLQEAQSPDDLNRILALRQAQVGEAQTMQDFKMGIQRQVRAGA